MSEGKRSRRTYTTEFKQQIVDSLLDKWIEQADNSGSFHEKDNRTPEQEELLKLRKDNQASRAD